MRVVVAIFSFVALCLIAIAVWASWTKPIPQSVKLVDCTNSMLRFTISCPKGDQLNIALGVAAITNLLELKPFPLHGKLQIAEGEEEIFQLEFDSEEARQDFWLRREQGIAGVMLTLPRREGQAPLAKILKPETRYQVAVSFSNALPAGSSLWLTWRQKRYQSN